MKTPKLSSVNIDGKGILASVSGIIDLIKYRKYAKEGFTTVIHINEQNNVVKILNGRITPENLVQVRELNKPYLVNKVYILPTKKLVTKCVIIKEDVGSTIDMQIRDNSKVSPQLLKQYEKIKIMEELKSFDLGQVLLGLLGGLVLGAVGMMVMIMMYNSMM